MAQRSFRRFIAPNELEDLLTRAQEKFGFKVFGEDFKTFLELKVEDLHTPDNSKLSEIHLTFRGEVSLPRYDNPVGDLSFRPVLSERGALSEIEIIGPVVEGLGGLKSQDQILLRWLRHEIDKITSPHFDLIALPAGNSLPKALMTPGARAWIESGKMVTYDNYYNRDPGFWLVVKKDPE